MKTKINTILRIAVLSMVALTSAHAQRVWINASGGTFVGPASNWASNTIPNSFDPFIFDATGAPATYTVTLDADYSFTTLGNQAGDSVTVDLNGNILNFSSANSVRSIGTLNFQNGTLTTLAVTFGREGIATSTLTGVTANVTAFSVGVTGVTNVDSSNSLVTLNGSTKVTATNTTTIGGAGSTGSTSANSKLLVTGGNTTFTGAEVRVGTTTNSTGNTLEVASGGALTGTNLFVGSFHSGGGSYSAGGNTVLIHGSNSTATLTGAISVGAANIATTVNNSLVVQNNGEFATSGSLVINGTSDNTTNRVVVESGGSVILNKTSNTVNFGFMEVNGGTLDAKGLTLANQGRLNFLDGTIAIDGNLSTSATGGGRFGFDLTGDDPITFTGIGIINGTLAIGSTANSNFIDIFGVTGLGNYTLFTSTGNMDANVATRLALGNTPIGFEGSLVYNPNSIVLNVGAIPEPNTAVLLAAGLMVLVMRARRRGVRA